MKSVYKLECKQRGIYDIYHVGKTDAEKKYLYHDIVASKENETNPRPFIGIIEIPENGVGSADGRVWIPYPGNLHGSMGFPQSMFRNQLEIEFFPVLASFAIRDIMNKYAPGEYCSKWPNDVVCKKHGKKTSGILVRKEGKWIFLLFCINLVKAPEDKLLRKQGLRACCMKNHTDNIPNIEDVFVEVGDRVMELVRENDDIHKIMDTMNKSLNEYMQKTYRVELNNPNADLLKDGTLWNRNFPNALTKGYMNGVPYEFGENYFDNVYYHVKGNADEKEADKNYEANKKKLENEEKK